MSAFYSLQEEVSVYVVTRKIQVENDIFMLEAVIRGADSVNAKLQHKAFSSVKNTSWETITDDFVELKESCKFGPDCRAR